MKTITPEIRRAIFAAHAIEQSEAFAARYRESDSTHRNQAYLRFTNWLVTLPDKAVADVCNRIFMDKIING